MIGYLFDRPKGERLEWAVCDGLVILHHSPRLSGRLLELWAGSCRLFKMAANGDLYWLVESELQTAERAKKRGKTAR